VELEEFVK
jgi:hypothetical protein